jgi:pyruvate dehydrogenase E1 component beta subunit
MNGAQAIHGVLSSALQSNQQVHVLGEALELSPATQGLMALSPKQAHLLPASDGTLTGLATGMALAGHRPVVELAGPAALWGALQQLGQEAAAAHGEFNAPIVLRVPFAPGEVDLSAILMALPGVVVAIPSGPDELAGMLRTALQATGPVVILEARSVLAARGTGVDTLVAFGHAALRREGAHASILACGDEVLTATAAADDLATEGHEVDVLDLGTLSPLDLETVGRSVDKTGRPILVGAAAAVLPQVLHRSFLRLESPPATCAGTAQAIAQAVRTATQF